MDDFFNNILMNKQIKIAISIISIARILQIFLDYNYEWPDEYWQGPEIAYKLANEYGFQTWQWTMQQPLRNIIYQAYLSIGYFVGNFFNFEPINKERAVKFMQVLLAVLCDWFVLKIALIYTSRLKWKIALLLLSNWFYFSMMNRTYINSVEACLTVIAFYFWLIRSNGKKYDLISRVVVGICFIIRTTSIILWAVIWPYELLTMKANRVKFIFKNITQIFIIMLASIGFNSYWYQKFTLIEYNFFKYNIMLKWSQLYGVNSFLYYFSFVIPFILASYLLPFVLSLFLNLINVWKKQENIKDDDDGPTIQKENEELTYNKKNKELIAIVLTGLVVLSFSAHKQPRFLLVFTPFLLILSLKGFKKLQNWNFILSILVLINLSFLVVFSFYGKNGGVKILRSIRDDIQQNYPNRLEDISIIYLCQPHSLPSYSIIQQNITFSLLDTSPLRKLEHFNEQIELKVNPLALYNQLIENVKGKPIKYLIIQQKYSIFNGYLREQYQFLLRDRFTMIRSERNINLWEEYQNGYDGFVLLKRQ